MTVLLSKQLMPYYGLIKYPSELGGLQRWLLCDPRIGKSSGAGLAFGYRGAAP
jgi:hypothetical protein